MNCKKKFEVKIINTSNFIQNKQRTNFQAKIKKFDIITNKIIQLILQNKTQEQISKELNTSKSTVSRRLNQLVNLNLIIETCRHPKLYKINDDIENEDNKEVNSVNCHHIQCICKIKAGMDNLNIIEGEKFKLKNWGGKHFKQKDLDFQINYTNTPNISFWVNGEGLTADEAIENAKQSAFNIKEGLEGKYNCKLSFPDFKFETGNQPIHDVIQTRKLSEVNKIKDYYSNIFVTMDDTHPGGMEIITNDKEARERILNDVLNVTSDVQELKEKLNNNNLENNPIQRIEDLSKAFNNLAQRISQSDIRTERIEKEVIAINQNLATFVNQMASIIPQNPQKSPGPNNMFS